MSEDHTTPDGADDLIIRGTFGQQDGTPIQGAAIHEVFLGDPPSNCGTCFDLEEAPAHTDSSGEFRLTLRQLDRRLAYAGPPGTWRRGCFLVLGVKDARVIGYVIASGDELAGPPARLVAIPTAHLKGSVHTESGLPVADAKVEVCLYLLFAGRGPCPSAPVNFWLSRPCQQPNGDPQPVTDLAASTGGDGEFVIPNAPMLPGQLRLEVSHPDFATLETTYYPYQPTTRLTLQAGAEVLIRVALPDGRPAVGFTFDLEGDLEGEHWAIHRDAVTDKGGQCVFRSLPPGSYMVRYMGGGEQPWAVVAIPVANLGKGERRDISVRAVEGSVLCGQVFESHSKAPLHHAEVRFESESYPRTASTFQATYTDGEGRFVFPFPVAPGPLDVAVSARHQGKRVGRRHAIVVGPEPHTELVFSLPLPQQ